MFLRRRPACEWGSWVQSVHCESCAVECGLSPAAVSNQHITCSSQDIKQHVFSSAWIMTHQLAWSYQSISENTLSRLMLQTLAGNSGRYNILTIRQYWGFWTHISPKLHNSSSLPPKRPSLPLKHVIWAIKRENRSSSLTCKHDWKKD